MADSQGIMGDLDGGMMGLAG